MWNISNSTEDHRRRKGKLKGGKSEGKMNHERLWTPGNKLRVFRKVGEWDGPVMGSKEGTYCMVPCVLYTTNESSNFPSEAGDVLYGD